MSNKSLREMVGKKPKEDPKSREDRKWDKGKLKYDLILSEFLETMAEILTKGEINHPREEDGTPSWKLVEPEAYINAMFRHLQEYRKDPQSVDEDMGTSHMGHIAVNAMFLDFLSRERV